MTEQISIPFSWDDLCDTIHYVEWKVEEVDENGCDLEHPNIRNVLKKLQYIRSRMRWADASKLESDPEFVKLIRGKIPEEVSEDWKM